MKITTKKIDGWKKELAEAKQEKAESEGVVKTLMARFESEFKVSTIEEALEKRKVYFNRKKKLKTNLIKLVEELEETYGL